MKEYEVVHEIFNQCSNNQMRDVFIEEVPIADLEAYVISRHQGERDFTYEREDLADGTENRKMRKRQRAAHGRLGKTEADRELLQERKGRQEIKTAVFADLY